MFIVKKKKKNKYKTNKNKACDFPPYVIFCAYIQNKKKLTLYCNNIKYMYSTKIGGKWGSLVSYGITSSILKIRLEIWNNRRISHKYESKSLKYFQLLARKSGDCFAVCINAKTNPSFPYNAVVSDEDMWDYLSWLVHILFKFK